jgi:hypothetical protein
MVLSGLLKDMVGRSGLLKSTAPGADMTLNMRQKLAIHIAVHEQFGENTAPEQLLEEICQLRFQIAELQKTNSDLRCKLYPESRG